MELDGIVREQDIIIRKLCTSLRIWKLLAFAATGISVAALGFAIAAFLK